MAKAAESPPEGNIVMATSTRRQAGLDAEAERLSARFSLGAGRGSWVETGALTRVAIGRLLLVLLVLAGLGALLSPAGRAVVMAGGTEVVVFAVVAAACVAIPPRSRRTRLFLFESGVVRASNVGRRLIVLPWDDLETVTLATTAGYDEVYVSGCVLRGRSGTRMELGRRESLAGRHRVQAAAQAQIAARRSGPLTAQLDAGRPVTIGFLTVDRSGLSSRGGLTAGGRWQVSWHQVRRVDVEVNGQRVLVRCGRWGAKRALLHGVPNSFLAGHVIGHAAGQAGVPMTSY